MTSGAHPSKEIVGTKGSELAGRRIVLCITGSIAAHRAIDLARLLMRHGADVYAVMTESTSSQLLSPEIMKWATGNDVVTKLTGELEHIRLADYGKSDLVVVYPCTANTIGKVSAGIDDTPVTSVLSVALGSHTPVVIAPAMHEAMYENPFIAKSVAALKRYATFVPPKLEEGKAKLADYDQLLRTIISVLVPGALAGRRVLVTSGSTVEHIDPIRVVTNLSTGTMGLAIVKAAEALGAQVTLVYGHGIADVSGLRAKVIRVSTGQEMLQQVTRELSSKTYDAAIMAAAVADFRPARSSSRKIDSRPGKLDVEFVKTEKIVDRVKAIDPDVTLVAFKADHDVQEKDLVNKALKKMKESGADFVVANDVGRVARMAGPDKNEVYLVDSKQKVTRMALDTKDAIAARLVNAIAEHLAEVKPRSSPRQSGPS